MKLSLFQSYLQKEKIDVAVFFHPDSTITYFTQSKPSSAILMITPKQAKFYLTRLDKPPKLKGMKVKILPKEWEKEFFNKKVKKLGINPVSLSVEQGEKLKKIYPSTKFVDINAKVIKLRQEKTSTEIKLITKACKITSMAFQALIQELPLKKMQTEQAVAFFLEKFIKDKGGEIAFPTIVATRKNSSIPHHQTSHTKLKKGFLQLDFGAQWKNYCADMSRVVYLGHPSEKEKQIYDHLLQLQEETIRQIQLGNPFKELDQYCRNLFGKEAKYFVHGLGHGVGIDIHEAPVFSKEKVSDNQVFTIEPGIYFPNKYGLRIEDTFLFAGKVKILTTASKELITIKGYS